MPQVFKVGSYWGYFWANENESLEPIHIHILRLLLFLRGGRSFLQSRHDVLREPCDMTFNKTPGVFSIQQ